MSVLRELQAELARTKELLLSTKLADPQQATRHLEQAADALSALKRHLLAEATQISPATLAELKREVRDVAALAGQAGSLYLECAAVLESLTREYTPGGTAGPLTSRPSLSLEG